MESPKDIFDSIFNAALAKNQQSMYTWSKYKEDLSTAQNLINDLTDKVSHNVMVPLGPKAIMPGKIVHTNEYLVSLGASYFTKQSAKHTKDYCERKIQNCNEMLHNLEEELKLMTHKKTLPDLNDAFGGGDDRPEIIEHVTEEENENWKEEHRKKEKEYRSQLADIRQEEKKKIESEQDLWERLDQLELEEELEDELNRLHESGDGSDSDDESENSLKESSENVVKEEEEVTDNNKQKVVRDSPKRKRSVIFAEVSPDCENEPLFLHFKHSSVLPQVPKNSENIINSPSDIYLSQIEKARNQDLVSILKVKRNPNQKKEVLAAAMLSDEDDEAYEPKVVSSGFEIPEVIEKSRSNVTENVSVPSRPISKFKASRMKK